jgi:arginyl-tRNA synthetase
VRISKRQGDYVPLAEVLDEAGVDAARYFFVERATDTPMDFDLGLAQMSTQANPVYYVQYAGARIRSILRQAGAAGRRPADPARLGEPAERALMLALAKFPEVVVRSAQERSPHHVPRYLTELAGLFHSFYRQHRCWGRVRSWKPPDCSSFVPC